MFLLCRNTASLQPRPQAEDDVYGCPIKIFVKKHLLVVYVHSLVHSSIQIDHGFKTRIIPAAGITEIKDSDSLFPLPFRRNLHFLVKPQKTVSSFPGFPCL